MPCPAFSMESDMATDKKPAISDQPGPDAPDAGATEIISLISRLSSEQKQLFKDALGIKDGIRKVKRNRPTNAQARRIVALYGDVYRPNGGGFHPSEAVFEKGPEAVAAARAKWEEGQTFSARQAEQLEALAATAVM